MDRRCAIVDCKREAETYCYHCSKDVCTKHYLEHKKWIQEQLHTLVDETNLIYERLRHGHKNQTAVPYCLITAHSQLDEWREECHQHIDIVYQRVQSQIEGIVESYKHKETQLATENLDLLDKMRQQLNELLKEGDVTFRQLESMKQQLEKIKSKKQEPIRYPDIRVVTHKINVDKCISVTTDIKHPNAAQQQPRATQNASLFTNSSLQYPYISDSSLQNARTFESSIQYPPALESPFEETVDECPVCFVHFPPNMTCINRVQHVETHYKD